MAIDINEEKSELALGHFLTLKTSTRGGSVVYRYQNFFIGETIEYSSLDYHFLPFGFSGVTVNSDGTGTDATLLVPTTAISKGWAIEALEDRWLGTVSVMILNPADKTQFGKLSEYNGQVSRGSWDDTRLNLIFNTVIDAVAGEVPQRRLSKRLVGDLPISSNVRLQ